jgi:hypothetical protein
METKTSQLLAMMAAENWIEAIKFAAKFPTLGKEASDIIRAKEAINNPDLYRQMKKDPEVLIAAGASALHRRFVIGMAK